MASEHDMLAELERLRAENERLKRPRGQTSMKVSEKGGLSVYGLGRFPVTLYREQWETLLGMSDEIRQFIADNDAALKKKEVRKPMPRGRSIRSVSNTSCGNIRSTRTIWRRKVSPPKSGCRPSRFLKRW